MRSLLAVFASTLLITTASAQQPASPPAMGNTVPPMPMMQPQSSDAASTKGYKAAMMSMMTAMPKEFTGNADIDFMRLMRAHHQSAVDMAEVALANGKDAEVKALAKDIISAQQKEIATIDKWLKAKAQ